jgi:hypothetical protein
MPKAASLHPAIRLRVRCSPALFERISEYRHLARHDTQNQALVTLIAAGLAALSKPVQVPTKTDNVSLAPKRPKLIGFAGNGREAP